MRTLRFHLSCVPPKTSHHAKRIARRGRRLGLVDTPQLEAAKDTLDALLLPHRPEVPITGPVALALEFTWPWLSDDSKRVRARGRVIHAARPDCDNLAKTLTDRLVCLRFLGDDGKVVSLSVDKFRGDAPGIAVAVMEVV